MPTVYNAKQNKKPTKRKRIPKKTLVIGLAVVALAVAAVAVLELTHTIDLFPTKTPPPPTPQVIPGETNTDKGSGNTQDKGSDKGTGSGSGDTTSTTPPLTPSGNFVSNHKPNLGGTPAPNNEQSSCTTTPGASCDITFTKDGVTKSLGAKTTDGNGSAFWSWTLQSVGLTEGTWEIKAVATLNGQTTSANDALSLAVAP